MGGFLVRRAGDCFFSTSATAFTAEEIIAVTWRVHAEDGALEVGLRFPIPTGLALEAPVPTASSPLPVCVDGGRMAVLLSGPSGYAWFVEGASAFEQLTPWTRAAVQRTAAYLRRGCCRLGVADRRHLSSHRRSRARCERRYEGSGSTLIDHELGLEPFVPGFTTIEWLESAIPTR